MAKQSKATESKSTRTPGGKSGQTRERKPWGVRANAVFAKCAALCAAIAKGAEKIDAATGESTGDLASQITDTLTTLAGHVGSLPADFKLRVGRSNAKVALEPGHVVQVKEKYHELYQETFEECGIGMDAELTVMKVSGRFVWVKLKGGARTACLASHLAPVME